jgi:hypothetical protein
MTRTQTPTHTEETMEQFVFEQIERVIFDADGDESPVRDVSTFEAKGIMTYNKGVVVSMADGTEFQVTIVRSA